MGFSYYQPPAGVAAEVDPSALKIANNLSDLNDAPTARTSLGLGDLAVGDDAADVLFDPAVVGNWFLGVPADTGAALDYLAVIGSVLNPAGASNGDVLSIDAGNVGWAAPEAGGGASAVSLGTVSTGNVAASGGTADFDFALPAGVTSCLITRATITRTAGTGTNARVVAHTKDDRSDTGRRIFGGDGFGTGVEIDPGPVEGPVFTPSGVAVFYPVHYYNADGSQFIRCTVENRDFSNDSTYDVTLYVLPLG